MVAITDKYLFSLLKVLVGNQFVCFSGWIEEKMVKNIDSFELFMVTEIVKRHQCTNFTVLIMFICIKETSRFNQTKKSEEFFLSQKSESVF